MEVGQAAGEPSVSSLKRVHIPSCRPHPSPPSCPSAPRAQHGCPGFLEPTARLALWAEPESATPGPSYLAWNVGGGHPHLQGGVPEAEGAERVCLPQQYFLKALRSPHLRPGRLAPLAPRGSLSQDRGPAGPGLCLHAPRTPSGQPAPRFTGEGPEARSRAERHGWEGRAHQGPHDSLGPRWPMMELGANASAREARRTVPGVGTPLVVQGPRLRIPSVGIWVQAPARELDLACRN